jgi:hypothetical protein
LQKLSKSWRHSSRRTPFKRQNCKPKVLELPNSDTPPPANNETASTTVSWWVWLAWIERERGGGFAYGCAAQSFHSAGWRDEDNFGIPGGGKLVVHQCTVADGNFKTFRDQLIDGTVDTALLRPSKVTQAQIMVWSMILPSEKTINRNGTHDGYAMICEKNLQCGNCETDSNCAVCGSRADCLQAVDKCADECFDSFFDRSGVQPKTDFYSLMTACINEHAGHKLFRN